MARADILGQGRKPGSQVGAPGHVAQPPEQLVTCEPTTAYACRRCRQRPDSYVCLRNVHDVSPRAGFTALEPVLALSPPTAGSSRTSPPVAIQDANQLLKMYIATRKIPQPCSGYSLHILCMGRFGPDRPRLFCPMTFIAFAKEQHIDRKRIFTRKPVVPVRLPRSWTALLAWFCPVNGRLLTTFEN
ncbi:hypothetical protein D9M72_474690 [compost metagenome]